ncbi:hypothetical protein CBL_08674 [Carabus blaptoides fortunei]
MDYTKINTGTPYCSPRENKSSESPSPKAGASQRFTYMYTTPGTELLDSVLNFHRTVAGINGMDPISPKQTLGQSATPYSSAEPNVLRDGKLRKKFHSQLHLHVIGRLSAEMHRSQAGILET